MKRNKKVMESMAVAALALAMSITSVAGNGRGKDANETFSNVGLEDSGVAGVAETLVDYELSASEELENNVTVEKEEVYMVAASAEEAVQEAAEAEPALTPEEQEWQSALMANVEQSLNVRAAGNEEAEIVGKLYKGDKATVVEAGSEWTKIQSGNVEGYVKNEYCVFGTDALAYAKANCDTVAKSTTDGLRIRKGQSTESGVVKTLAAGDEVKVDLSAETEEGWVAVNYRSAVCYVSADYVEVSLKTGTGMTLEEEAQAKAAEEEAKKKKEAEKAAAASKQTKSSGTTQGASLAASVDDVTLLAALIQCEAGGQSYECQLAVGAVVVNRVRSGSYPGSIYGVIYQRGQFSPASSGKLESRLAKGVSGTAYSAAQAALGGADNTGGATSFKLASSGHSGVVVGPIVFF